MHKGVLAAALLGTELGTMSQDGEADCGGVTQRAQCTIGAPEVGESGNRDEYEAPSSHRGEV